MNPKALKAIERTRRSLDSQKLKKTLLAIVATAPDDLHKAVCDIPIDTDGNRFNNQDSNRMLDLIDKLNVIKKEQNA
jgi:hypothetical protein